MHEDLDICHLVSLNSENLASKLKIVLPEAKSLLALLGYLFSVIFVLYFKLFPPDILWVRFCIPDDLGFGC